MKIQLVLIVLAYNIPFVKSIYAGLERFALHLLVGILKKEPAIKSIYLRRSSSAGENITGLSDIDIGVVIEVKDGVLEAKQSVYKRYMRFIRYFPRGLFDINLSIYTVQEVNNIVFDVDVRGVIDTHLCYRLLEGIYCWKLLFGKATLPRDIPDYPSQLRDIILSREVIAHLHAMSTIYRSYAPGDFLSGKSRLNRIKLLYRIYKSTSDTVRLLVLYTHRELPWTFNRKDSIESGIKYLGSLLRKEDLDFLRKARRVPDELFNTKEAGPLLLQYIRFALRFVPLARTDSGIGPFSSRAESASHISDTRMDVANKVNIWYPEFCPSGSPTKILPTVEAPPKQTRQDDISEWFHKNRPACVRDVIIVHRQNHSFQVCLKLGSECHELELRALLEMCCKFDKFHRDCIKGHLLVSISLYLTECNLGLIPLELDKVTMFCMENPGRGFTGLYPTLFITENDSLAWQYEKFWVLMFFYSQLWALLHRVFSESLFWQPGFWTEEIMQIFINYPLPDTILQRLDLIYRKYSQYLDNAPSEQPAYSEFISCLISFEEYLKSEVAAGSKNWDEP